jgi:hypothetical protein
MEAGERILIVIVVELDILKCLYLFGYSNSLISFH